MRPTTPPGTSTSTSRPGPAPQSNRKLAYSAHVAVEVGDAAQALYKAEAIVASHHGFVLNSSLTADDEGAVTARIMFRVPRSGFSSAVTEVSRLGRLRERQVTGRDLTQQYLSASTALRRDQQTYVSLKDARRRHQKTKDRLAVEDRLKDVRESGGQHRSEIAAVLGQTELATVSATFVEGTEAIAPTRLTWRTVFTAPMRSLVATGKAFALITAWVLVYVPLWGPVVGFVVWRRRRARRSWEW